MVGETTGYFYIKVSIPNKRMRRIIVKPDRFFLLRKFCCPKKYYMEFFPKIEFTHVKLTGLTNHAYKNYGHRRKGCIKSHNSESSKFLFGMIPPSDLRI